MRPGCPLRCDLEDKSIAGDLRERPTIQLSLLPPSVFYRFLGTNKQVQIYNAEKKHRHALAEVKVLTIPFKQLTFLA